MQFVRNEIISGRVLESIIHLPGNKELVLFNVHNADLDSGNILLLTQRLDAQRSRALRNPLLVEVLVGGDFNFFPEGGSRTFLHGPKHSSHFATPAVQHGPLRRAMSHFLEFAMDCNTHYDHQRHTESRLDHWYASTPSTVLRLVRSVTSTSHVPYQCGKKRVSDHVILFLSFDIIKQKQVGQPKIPSWVARHSLYTKSILTHSLRLQTLMLSQCHGVRPP